MKLSTKGRYGLRVMYYLAIDAGKVISLSELSYMTGVSSPYLEKILGYLKKGNLVSTERGANGGYLLSRPAKEISIGPSSTYITSETFISLGSLPKMYPP